MTKNKAKVSKMVKGSGKNFFFDIYETKNGKDYLRITESRWSNEENKKGERSSIYIWQSDLDKFGDGFSEVKEKVAAF